MKLNELIKDLQEATLQGDPACDIHGVDTIQQAQTGTITFLINPLYKKYLQTTKASAVILTSDDAKEVTNQSLNLIITKNPHYIYSRIAAFFIRKPKPQRGIHPSAVVGERCEIDSSVSIGANAVVGNQVKIAAGVIINAGVVVEDFTEIDENSVIEANATLCHHTKIGKRVLISNNTVIGSDGFGNARHQGKWHKVPQLGRVIIEDDVEIGANTAIDRGAIDDTVIEKGARLDNLIQVGHNVRVGENTAIAGCVGIAGSATIGKNCLIGGGTGVNGHITIADNTIVTGFTEVSKSIREPGVYSSGVGGLVTNLEWRKNTARFQRLEILMERVKKLEALVKKLGSQAPTERDESI